MIETKTEEFNYKQAKDNPAVLGILEGPCADVIDPTRNGRKYSEELWEQVFSSDLVKEQIEAGGIFGEACHPADGRMTVDPEKIAIAMKEIPTKDANGKLQGRFYILNTPCGKILKTLCDFGYKPGISSRGSGDLVENADGTDDVVPESYDFVCFDAVLVPAVKAARLSMVEGLEKKVSLQEALKQQISDSDEKDKKAMIETLSDLNIEYDEESTSSENSEDLHIDSKQAESDVGSAEDDLLASLQEALVKNSELEVKLSALQEDLSVSYTKEIKLSEQLSKYKAICTKLNNAAKKVKILEDKVSELESENKSLTEEVDSKSRLLDESDSKIKTLSEDFSKSSKQANEVSIKKDAQISKLKSEVVNLKKSLIESKVKNDSSKQLLEQKLSKLQKEHSEKETKLKTLVEKYKLAAAKSVNKYIESKAFNLGLSVNEIKNKLPERYSFEDIDTICESLRDHRLVMTNLPFSLNESLGQTKQIKIKPDKSSHMFTKPDNGDEVDEFLLDLAGTLKI